MVAQMTLEHPPTTSRDAEGRGDSLSSIAAPAQYQQDPAGGFCPIGVQQLCMAWWLYQNKYLTRRQFRLYFACHEINARRPPRKKGKATNHVYRGGDMGYRPTNGPEKAYFPVLEALKLLGEQTDDKCVASVRSDFRRLCRIGLIDDSGPRFKFAKSFAPGSISRDDVDDFHDFFNTMPNRRRTVPVPRRTLRALAGGFTRAITGVMLAYLIRSLFWHKDTDNYRIDGRTKGSWIAENFRLSRKSVTEGRKRLIELGWIKPLDVTQWEMNKWGWHDELNPDLKFCDPQASETPEASQDSEGTADVNLDTSGVSGGGREFTSPQDDSDPVFTSPIKERKKNLLHTEESKNRIPPRKPKGSEGANAVNGDEESVVLILEGSNSNLPSSRAGGVNVPPNLNDIQPEDFQSTTRLLGLHRQACERSLADPSEAGRLDFLALCERALAIGEDPCRMLAWLLKKQRYAWISQSDEDRAAERLRRLRNPRKRKSNHWTDEYDQDKFIDLAPPPPSTTVGESARGPAPGSSSLSGENSPDLADEKFILACIKIASQHRVDPFHIARQAKGWTLEDWRTKRQAMEQRKLQKWQPPEAFSISGGRSC